MKAQQNYSQLIKMLIATDERLKIDLGLKRVSKVLELFSNPQDKIKTIHIAGTNGKGTCARIFAKVFKKSGYKVALYTSPHLRDYNERISVDERSIPDDIFLELVEKVIKKANLLGIFLTEFEILTVVGFIYFKQEEVDIAIIETGLGGRLDATNVILKPILTVITSISKDHTAILGKTIQKIATEKGGIIKSNVPVVISRRNRGFKFIEKVAARREARIILSEERLKMCTSANNCVREATKLVHAGIEYLKADWERLSEVAFWGSLNTLKNRARFEYFKELNLLVDGAHNPDGAKFLRADLKKNFPKKSFNFIYAAIRTKDYEGCIKNLILENDEIIFYDFDYPTAVEFKKIDRLNKKRVLNSREEVMDFVRENAENADKMTVLTGSLYAIGGIYTLIENS